MAKPITLLHQVRSGAWESMISATGGLPAHRYTPQVTPRWPRGSEPASVGVSGLLAHGSWRHRLPLVSVPLVTLMVGVVQVMVLLMPLAWVL